MWAGSATPPYLYQSTTRCIGQAECQASFIPLFLSALFALCLCERGHFMVVSGERKYFYLAISGSMEMCLPVQGQYVHFIIMDIKQLVDRELLCWSLVNPADTAGQCNDTHCCCGVSTDTYSTNSGSNCQTDTPSLAGQKEDMSGQ